MNADFDGSGSVNGFDFLAWQRGFGTVFGALPADGDATGDYDVDSEDLSVWESQYGTTSISFIVDTLVDEQDSDYSAGDLSLREALLLAADEVSYPGTDEIGFDATLFSGGPATMTLNGSRLSVNSDVEIIGPGSELLTIDAGGLSRVFVVELDSQATISGITITGGWASSGSGGGLHNSGNLTLVDSRITGNSTRLSGNPGSPGGGFLIQVL